MIVRHTSETRPMKRRTSNGAITAAVLCLAVGTFQILRAQTPTAVDLVFSNGKIVTVDERFTIAQAVAVKGDRIVAVGSSQEIAKLAGLNTRTIDLRGRTAIPGLIDTLEDEEASVREAALVSLRALSGQNIPFDPLARDGDRSKRVKAWRDWWEEASKELLAQPKSKSKS